MAPTATRPAELEALLAGLTASDAVAMGGDELRACPLEVLDRLEELCLAAVSLAGVARVAYYQGAREGERLGAL